MHLELSAIEARVLGCLLEKERTTPEAYPLTLNSLTAAVNQTTNRDPVMSVDTAEVEAALEELRTKKGATLVMLAGSRAPKFRHQLQDHYNLEASETALICVLLLRGAQTVGELKARTERMHPFAHPDEVEQCLIGMESGDEPAVRQLPPQPGQKGRRWVQLISGEPAYAFEKSAPPVVRGGPTGNESWRVRVEALEAEVAALRLEFAEFRRQDEKRAASQGFEP